jgi:hypothetical protein
MTTMTTTTAPAADASKPKPRPYIPHTAFLRELTMPDGRKVMIDKRHLTFVCEARKDENGAKAILAARGMKTAVPVVEGYHDLTNWWRSNVTAGNGKGDRP